MYNQDIVRDMGQMLNQLMFSYLEENIENDSRREWLKQKKSLLLVRSGPVHILNNFIKQLAGINPDMQLWVIGKESDREVLEEYYPNQYVLDAVDGVYSVENIKPITDFEPDVAAFFTTLPYDENYMNIMELVESIYAGKEVMYCDFNHKIGLITDYEKYLSTLRLELGLADWNWKVGGGVL